MIMEKDIISLQAEISKLLSQVKTPDSSTPAVEMAYNFGYAVGIVEYIQESLEEILKKNKTVDS